MRQTEAQKDMCMVTQPLCGRIKFQTQTLKLWVFSDCSAYFSQVQGQSDPETTMLSFKSKLGLGKCGPGYFLCHTSLGIKLFCPFVIKLKRHFCNRSGAVVNLHCCQQLDKFWQKIHNTKLSWTEKSLAPFCLILVYDLTLFMGKSMLQRASLTLFFLPLSLVSCWFSPHSFDINLNVSLRFPRAYTQGTGISKYVCLILEFLQFVTLSCFPSPYSRA